MRPPDLARVSISRKDWSLHGQGSQDEARHNEKVKEAIKGNLDTILSDGTIITADPNSKRKVKVPLRSLELPRIKHKQGNGGVGTGGGEQQVGDVIDSRPVDGKGKGKEAGTKPGGETYEVEFTIDEIKEMVFDDLGLPFLKPKKQPQMETDVFVFDETRKKTTPSNLDIYRTVEENMRRNAQDPNIRRAVISGIRPDDYRVRTWRNEVKEENAAVVISMADISGSMGDFEKYITRSVNWWGVEFLRSKYPRVETAFIVHDTDAYEVTEADFFKRSDGGGTKCSSAAELALDVVSKRFSPESYNIYLQHYSDGGNYDADNSRYVEIINELLKLGISHFAYVNIGAETSWGGLKKALTEGIGDERFLGTSIKDKGDVRRILQEIYDPTKQAAA